MTFKPLVLLASFLAACAAPPISEPVREAPLSEASIAPPPAEPGFATAAGQEIWAYNAHWMGEAWRTYDLAAFGRLLFFDLEVGKDGRIETRNGWPEQWSAFRRKAREARVPIEPVVTLLSAEVFSAVFASPEARARLVNEVVAVARAESGVHLDVEIAGGVQPAELQAFRDFVQALRRRLDASPRKLLTAFVPAVNILYGPDELAMLDAVVAQGYDVHWQASRTAGPPAALDGDSPAAWRKAASSLARLGVPPRKLLFSTPLYGYEWPTVSGDARAATRAPASIITYAPAPASLLPDIRTNALSRAAQHGLRRESATGSPWYVFRDPEGWRQGWFDDPVSLAPRLAFVQAGDYRGVAIFVLGYDGGTLLETIQSSFRARSATAGGASPAAGR